MTQTALILGASGKIGRHFDAAFRAAGWQTRAYVRGTDMAAAAQGCAVIVNGLNPPAYHDWATLLPAITAQVIGAARASGAAILFPGNVYVFGLQPGPWSETTPHRPDTRKGALRAEAEAAYRAAAAEGVRTIVLRAGDFLTPAPQDSALDVVYWRDLKKGRVTAFGDPDAPRAHAWLPDMARAGVALVERRDSLPMFADIPFAGHAFSVNDLAALTAGLTGRKLTVARFPWPLLTLLSPFWELARELREMRPLFSHPHRLSGDLLARLVPEYRDTPLETAIAQALRGRGHDLGGKIGYAARPDHHETGEPHVQASA